MAWSESLMQYPIWYHTLSHTQVGWAAEKAGCAEEQESFKNLWPRTGSWKRTGKRGAGLQGGKATCFRSCKTCCDLSPSLIASPHPRLRHFLSRTCCWTFSTCKKHLLTSFPQHRFRSLPKPQLWVGAFSLRKKKKKKVVEHHEFYFHTLH